MKLQFRKLEIERFRSFGARQAFELDPSVGLWFLRGENSVEPQLGSNGSGKSSIFNALCWVLYGKTAQGLKNPDLKPWASKDIPRVKLTLDIDGETHVIERTAKTNGLTIDGEGRASEEAEKLIGLPFEAFVNTLYLAQGLPLFYDRTAQEKLDLFAEVLKLDKWERRALAANARVRELESLESEMLGERNGLDIALKQNAELVEKSRAASTEWEKDREDRAKKAGADIAAMEKDFKEKQAVLDKADLEAETAWIKLRQMREDVRELRKKAGAAERQYADELLEIRAVEQEVERVKQDLKELSTAKNCPTCGQPMAKKDVAATKADLNGQLEELQSIIKAGPDKKLKAQHEAALKALNNFEAELDKTERETDAVSSRVNAVKPEVERLKASILAAKSSQQYAANTVNPHAEQLSNLRRQKSKLEAQVEELDDDILKAQKQIERTKFWVKGFKDVALYLIEEVLIELEAVTNATLGEVGLAGWGVKYAMERETKSGSTKRGVTVTVLPPEDYLASGGTVGPIRWESWSGGEEQRLRLVGAVALSDVLLRHSGISSNLEIFDEPSKYLSGAGVDDLCVYLRYRAQSQEKTVWLIDHLVEESAVMAGTRVVQKTENGSVISK